MRLALLVTGLMVRQLSANIGGPIPQYPPQTVFNLFNMMHQCVARLQHSYGVSLMQRDLSQLLGRISELQAAHDLTLSTTEHCDFGQQAVDGFSVEFCGDTNNFAFNGVLSLEFIHASMNTSSLREILLSSTNRNCGLDSAAIIVFTMTLLALLAMLGLGALKAAECCQQTAPYQQFDRDGVRLFRQASDETAKPGLVLPNVAL